MFFVLGTIQHETRKLGIARQKMKTHTVRVVTCHCTFTFTYPCCYLTSVSARCCISVVLNIVSCLVGAYASCFQVCATFCAGSGAPYFGTEFGNEVGGARSVISINLRAGVVQNSRTRRCLPCLTHGDSFSAYLPIKVITVQRCFATRFK